VARAIIAALVAGCAAAALLLTFAACDPCPTCTEKPTPVPTSLATRTATPTATLTATLTPTATPTVPPGGVVQYLPILQ
jgi:hypothetical protein